LLPRVSADPSAFLFLGSTIECFVDVCLHREKLNFISYLDKGRFFPFVDSINEGIIRKILF